MNNFSFLKIHFFNRFLRFPAFLFGLLISGFGFVIYISGVLLAFLRIFFDPGGYWLGFLNAIVWYSGIPVIIGVFLVFLDLFLLLPYKKSQKEIIYNLPKNIKLTVALTAYNDELSIGLAVDDFLSHPLVKRVIVVDNNSKDNTAEIARKAGAIVVNEFRQGYGYCVWRALKEGSNYSDTELTLLCEGDMTFRAYDIDKLISYLPHADVVNGTRISEQLRSPRTQLTTFMYYGNFFAGKLLELKHIGRGTFTDVGTTYKLCRNTSIKSLHHFLNPKINLEFNAHFLDVALKNAIPVVECPITFHNRIGISKGGNSCNFRALTVGLRMIIGIVFGWKE
jgi:glycosyltransferase involved in cell wall biosynthesis